VTVAVELTLPLNCVDVRAEADAHHDHGESEW
jgi:hypothetical protein